MQWWGWGGLAAVAVDLSRRPSQTIHHTPTTITIHHNQHHLMANIINIAIWDERVNIVVIVFSLQVFFVAGQSSHSCRYPTCHLESAFLPPFLHPTGVVGVQCSAVELKCREVSGWDIPWWDHRPRGHVSSSLFVFVLKKDNKKDKKDNKYKKRQQKDSNKTKRQKYQWDLKKKSSPKFG